MRKTIGLIAGGFKPLTIGHWVLIERASAECDTVFLFISKKDRVRPGEHPIYWTQMRQVWSSFLIKALPSNVKPTFSEAPIKNIMDVLNAANKNQDNLNTYIIYSDEVDREANYPERAQEKYMSRLLANDQVIFQDIKRISRPGGTVSGTLMRKYLETGDLWSFISGLPKPVRIYGPEIFRLLGGKKTITPAS